MLDSALDFVTICSNSPSSYDHMVVKPNGQYDLGEDKPW